MKTANKKITYLSKGRFDFIDITEKIKNFVEESQINDGLINIQTLHTTTAIIINENEPLLLEDIKNNLEELAPSSNTYNHDNFEKRAVNLCPNECDNGHSHCKAIHLPTSLTLNILKGEVQLGTWQRIMFLELDRPRERSIQLQIIGE